jgi:endonuclease YncB( thermonuclease family)
MLMLGTFVRIAGCLGLILIASVQATERVIVKDGDTLELGDTTFRLHGIDAPEFNQLCVDEKDQEWKCGLAARDALVEWIGKRAVRCDDQGPDTKYPKRRIGLCFVEGMEMNEWMVRQGWAINFEPYAKRRYLAAQRDAETNRRGIWKGCFAAPGDIRHWKKSAPLMGSPCSPDARARIFREDACSIKGNRRSHKYHLPGCPNYDSTTQDVQMLCSEDEARAEGYTKAGNCPR